MENGAKGVEVIISGKLRAQRAKAMKFRQGGGHLSFHCGELAAGRATSSPRVSPRGTTSPKRYGMCRCDRAPSALRLMDMRSYRS